MPQVLISYRHENENAAPAIQVRASGERLRDRLACLPPAQKPA